MTPDLLHALLSLQRVHGVLEGGEQTPLDVESPGVLLPVRTQLGHHAVLEGETERGGLQQAPELLAFGAGAQAAASRGLRLVNPHVPQLQREEGLWVGYWYSVLASCLCVTQVRGFKVSEWEKKGYGVSGGGYGILHVCHMGP